MMGIYIKGMEMPTSCYECPLQDDECFGSIKCQYAKTWGSARMRAVDCPLIPVPPHGRLIDADALRQTMYHEAFETDSPMQKWDSGCWIRYKMFERTEETAPTIIPASEEGET